MAAPAPARNTNTDQVEASAAVLDVLLPRLQERREAIQKEVLKYGEAPAGIKEVFELCRGFERAYVSFVNESPVASKIKESFMGDKGLAGMIRKQPIEKVYDLGNVKQMTRQADGYQPHLVSPETGMRRLASEALDFVAGPVGATVQQVYTLLLNAAREAAEKAGQHTEAALMGALPMVVPDFKNVVMPAIVVALDEWKRDAEKMAMMLVDMERSYMTAGFFRHTMYHRANKIKQQLQMAQASQQANVQPGGGAAAGGSGKPAGRSFFPAFGASTKDSPPPPLPPGPAPSAPSQQAPQGASTPAKAPPNADGASDASGEEPAEGASTPQQPPASGGAFNASDMTDPNSFLAGFFEKYNANDNAFLSIAGGLRWQKRFFIYSEAQRMLYYFKSAEDVSKGGQPRGTVNVSECVVEDLDAQGNVRTGGPPPSNTADKANLLLRVRHKDPRQMTLKDHTALILRADTYDQKTQWLSRLRRAADPPKRPAKPAGGEGQAGAEGQPGGQPFSSFGGSLSNTTPEDMSWAKDAEPIIDTHLGEGSSAFRADNVRDGDGRLLPAPQTVINPLRLSDKVRKLTGNAAADARHDTIMEQFGGDMCIYTRMICDTVITTVPKAIVHCMIRKSEKNLLERLFTVIHHLTPVQLEQLLREEDGVVNARREARAALEDTKQAIFVVQQVLERRNMASATDRPPNVTLPANCFAYAGMPELLTKEQREFYDQLFSSEHAPEAMKNWTVPPQLRALPPVLAAAAAKAVNAVRSAGAPPGQPARPGAPPGGAPLARPSTQPGAGGPPPPRPAAPGQAPPGQAPPVVRRAAPPPPPGGR